MRMSANTVATLLAVYFATLLLIAWRAGRGTGNRVFFEGKRRAHWGVVAFGMIGVSLSGISFISVPGLVLQGGFHYLQMVLGYVVGYYIIAYVLLPVYYRLRIPSIYSYLATRLGAYSHKSGAALFLISRITIASLRLFVVSTVLHATVFDAWGIPFWVTVMVTLGLIWAYTHRAGIQVVVWTDIFQTAVMLLCLVLTIVAVCTALDYSPVQAVQAVARSGHASLFEFSDWRSPHHFVKQFIAGAFVPVVMTGLDQDMMQKNLTCRTLRDGQRNMITYGYGFLPINALLRTLGLLLVLYAGSQGLPIPERGDALYPSLATAGHLGPLVGFLFTLGIIAATFSSADSALTALTSSFTLDVLGLPLDDGPRVRRTRHIVHLSLAAVMVGIILGLRQLGSQNAIATLFTAVGYTYGPLLGLFAFALFTRSQSREWVVPIVCLLSPLACYGLAAWLRVTTGYQVGYELLLINGLITFSVLYLTRRRQIRPLRSGHHVPPLGTPHTPAAPDHAK